MSLLRSPYISTFMLFLINFAEISDAGWAPLGITHQLECKSGKGNNGLLYLAGKNGFFSGSRGNEGLLSC